MKFKGIVSDSRNLHPSPLLFGPAFVTGSIWGRPLLSRPPESAAGARGAVGSGLRLLSRPRFRSSRCRAGCCVFLWVNLGLDGCEVPCVSRLPRCLFTSSIHVL
jgi:hypothetical protein